MAERIDTERAVLTAREWIDGNFRSPLCRTRTVSEAVHLDLSRLCHAYARAFGETIGQTIRVRRIRAAIDLLHERPRLLLKDVAARVGYAGSTYRTFLNAFRSEMGMRPTESRSIVVDRDRDRAARRTRRPS